MDKPKEIKEDVTPSWLLIILGSSFFLPMALILLMKVWDGEGFIPYLLIGVFFLYSVYPLLFHTFPIPSKLVHGFYLFNGLVLLLVIPQEFVRMLILIASTYLLCIFINYKTSYLRECQFQLEYFEIQHKNLNYQLSECTHQIGELTNTQQELQKINSSLREMATTDELTRLLNKSSFNDCFLAELSRAARNGQTFTLVFLEINHFSIFNENNHRKIGEDLLTGIANILRETLRLTDVVSRYEWDLFAMILTEADLDLANKIIQRINRAVEKYPFKGREVLPSKMVSFSVGVANFPLDGFEIKDLMEKAEMTLQEARVQENFSNLKYFSIYSDLLHERVDNHQELVNEVKALLTIIDKKDNYTYRHSEQVVKYSLALAHRIKLDKNEINKLKIAAILHDVGKIEIDAELLNKSGSLTMEELNLLKKHPVIGANLINSFQGLKDIVPLIRYHHENYDGTGYPTGLKGEEIPIAARILALADSFDAMLNQRPYRVSLSLKEALEEIRSLAGIKYDPRLVSLFAEIVNQGLKSNVS